MTRRFLAILTAFALMSSQMALASFACPFVGESPQAMDESMDAGACPEAMRDGSRTICHKTVQAEPSKHDVPSVDVPPVPVSDARPVARVDAVSIALLAMPPDADLLRATSPPPRIRHSRFLK
ncbi:hypothetical protein BWI17_07830 [Betaproteobacteria bacterium GR16-43]|nr:hypothetical protein BWI17_07830 [Betaproteobacteria bacterium GR16-43]